MHELSSSQQQIIQLIIGRLQEQFLDEPSGHDWWHMQRVHMVACSISDSTRQRHDRFVVELGALLHDIADWKFYSGDESEGPRQAETLLTELGVDSSTIQQVKTIISEISFKGAQVETPMSSLEGKIVQDADRLDALGAIGIARAFAYGGKTGRPLYDPTTKNTLHTSFAEYKQSNSATLSHFYEKLLLLKDRMNTPLGKQMALQRHVYVEQFLQQFLAEWEGRI